MKILPSLVAGLRPPTSTAMKMKLFDFESTADHADYPDESRKTERIVRLVRCPRLPLISVIRVIRGHQYVFLRCRSTAAYQRNPRNPRSSVRFFCNAARFFLLE